VEFLDLLKLSEIFVIFRPKNVPISRKSYPSPKRVKVALQKLNNFKSIKTTPKRVLISEKNFNFFN